MKPTPYDSQIAEKTREAAANHAAWAEHTKKGEKDAAEQNRVTAVKLNDEIVALKKSQAEHREMLDIGASIDGDMRTPGPRAMPPPSATPDDALAAKAEANVAILAKLDREVVFDALNIGVDKAAKRYALAPGVQDALHSIGAVHDRAFRAYIGSPTKRTGEARARKLVDGLPTHVQNAMWTTEEDEGGFLAPPTYRTLPIENRIKPGVMRRLARVEPTKGDLKIPVIKQPTANKDYLITDFTGAWVAEGNRQSNEQVLNVDQLTIPTHEWQGYWVPVTEKLMKNAGANVADIIMRTIMAAANLAEEVAFWTGDGANKPEGLLRTGNSVAYYPSGHASLLTPAGLRGLHFTLRAPYRENGTYVMNSLTYGVHVLGLESSGGTYVFQQFAAGGPMTLFGRPVEFCELLDSVSAGTYPILFADFQELYTIAEDSALRIIRSDEKFVPQIAFLPTLTIGGQTTQLAAAIKQKVAAS